jgi:hypothetical protein
MTGCDIHVVVSTTPAQDLDHEPLNATGERVAFPKHP